MKNSQLVENAKLFAEYAHEGQYRKYNKQPYIVHPERVAKRTSEFTNDDRVVAAAWLHDIVEDCEVTVRDLELAFGPYVAWIVSDLTNPSKDMVGVHRADRKMADRLHLKGASESAQLIKVIDRIDNLKDISLGPKDFKKLYAKETLLLLEVLTKAPQVLREELKCLAADLLVDRSGVTVSL